jgi:hypothetical protein
MFKLSSKDPSKFEKGRIRREKSASGGNSTSFLIYGVLLWGGWMFILRGFLC